MWHKQKLAEKYVVDGQTNFWINWQSDGGFSLPPRQLPIQRIIQSSADDSVVEYLRIRTISSSEDKPNWVHPLAVHWRYNIYKFNYTSSTLFSFLLRRRVLFHNEQSQTGLSLNWQRNCVPLFACDLCVKDVRHFILAWCIRVVDKVTPMR